MKLERMHIFRKADKLTANACVDVPGLGKIETEVGISDETAESLEAQAIAIIKRNLHLTTANEANP